MSYSFEREAHEVKVIAAGGLGDCLLVSPFIRHFKQSTGGRVICITYRSAGELFDRNPYLDRLVLLEERELMLWALPEEGAIVFTPFYTPRLERSDGLLKVDAVPIGAPNQKGESILMQMGRRAGIDATGFRPEIFTDPVDEEWAETVAAGGDGRPLVIVNPESVLPEKNWAAEAWRELAAGLAGSARMVLLGEDSFGLRPFGVEDVPRPGIRSAAALYRRAACVATVDSLPGHLAVAAGTRAVVLFGPSNPAVFGHPQNVNLRAPSCPPCADTERRPACTDRRCLRELSPAEVLGRVRAVIEETRGAA